MENGEQLHALVDRICEFSRVVFFRSHIQIVFAMYYFQNYLLLDMKYADSAAMYDEILYFCRK